MLDFGIAKVTGTEALSGVATQTGMMLGTPYYMSPEQAQGNKAVDHRSDLFSLAVITYEALVGVRPFESDALGDLLMRIIMHPLPVPSQSAPWLGQGFDLWWAKAAARSPDERFQSVREMVDALADSLGRSAVPDRMSRPMATPEAQPAFVQTNTALASTAERKKSSAPLVFGGLVVLAIAAAALFAFKSRGNTPTAAATSDPTASRDAAIPPPSASASAPSAVNVAPVATGAGAAGAPAAEAKNLPHDPARPAGVVSKDGKPHGKEPDVKPPTPAAPGGPKPKTDLGF